MFTLLLNVVEWVLGYGYLDKYVKPVLGISLRLFTVCMLIVRKAFGNLKVISV